jgi:hypothetical protein
MPPMARSCLAALACAALAPVFALAADPPTSPAVAAAIAEAKSHLAADRPAAAVAALEKVLAAADGNRAYLDQLRAAYTAELNHLQQSQGDARQLADLRTKLGLLGGPTVPPEPPAPITPPTPPGQTPVQKPDSAEGTDSLRQAATLFNEARAALLGRPKDEPKQFGLAARLFALAFSKQVELSPEQLAAWAYCRVRVANDTLNRSGNDPAAASGVIAEVEDALALAPTNAGLQKVGSEVIAAARKRAGATAAGRTKPAAGPDATGWQTLETASFRVRHAGQRDKAEATARAAEAQRGQIFARWSGPPGGDWQPKCEIVLHPNADAFAKATRQPAAATGRAVVKLADGRAVERSIDLRGDDPTLADDALPRELSYVVLADLYADRAPPKWAEVGMAVLASSPAEVNRYRQTLPRCAQSGELIPLATLFELANPPADRVTGFYVGSVTLVDFLVRWKGEKAFTTFLRDSQRYGLASAMKRQYGVSDARQLEELWKRGELASARGQAQQ